VDGVDAGALALAVELLRAIRAAALVLTALSVALVVGTTALALAAG
jgi:hypothetical protein